MEAVRRNGKQVPIHTISPPWLHPPRGIRRVPAACGAGYDFGGRSDRTYRQIAWSVS
jgi:hypothetical protein